MKLTAKQPSYFGWTDPDPKRTPEQKIGDALERYQQKHGIRANLVIVHPEQVCEVNGVTVRTDGTKKDLFLVGRE